MGLRLELRKPARKVKTPWGVGQQAAHTPPQGSVKEKGHMFWKARELTPWGAAAGALWLSGSQPMPDFERKEQTKGGTDT